MTLFNYFRDCCFLFKKKASRSAALPAIRKNHLPHLDPDTTRDPLLCESQLSTSRSMSEAATVPLEETPREPTPEDDDDQLPPLLAQDEFDVVPGTLQHSESSQSCDHTELLDCDQCVNADARSNTADPLTTSQTSEQDDDSQSLSVDAVLQSLKAAGGDTASLSQESQEKLKNAPQQNAASRNKEPGAPSSYVNRLETKKRKREEKTIDTVMADLSKFATPEEKLANLCRLYADIVEENRVYARSIKETEKLYAKAVKEKQQGESECSKQTLARVKLENLCRELQKANRTIKEESVAQLKDEESKRRELSDKFQSSLQELGLAMNSGKERNSLMHQENVALAQKMKALIEQYEAKDNHATKLAEAKNLEVQLFEAKMKNAQIEALQQEQVFNQEKARLLTQLRDKTDLIQSHTEAEIQLKTQLATYANKYEEFQNSLKESNDVFHTFKSEMDKMTKNLASLEKETKTWKSKFESTNKALIESLTEKVDGEKLLSRAYGEMEKMKKKNDKLEKLCRALAKRNSASPNNMVSDDSVGDDSGEVVENQKESLTIENGASEKTD